MTHSQMRQERMRICVVWHDKFTNEARKNENACCVTYNNFAYEARKNKNVCCVTWLILKWGQKERMRMCVVWHDTFTNETKRMRMRVVWHNPFTNEARMDVNVCCVTWHIHKWGKKECECVLCDMTHSQMRQERMTMLVVWHVIFTNEARKNENACCVTENARWVAWC
jgi:hypothetical protein